MFVVGRTVWGHLILTDFPWPELNILFVFGQEMCANFTFVTGQTCSKSSFHSSRLNKHRFRDGPWSGWWCCYTGTRCTRLRACSRVWVLKHNFIWKMHFVWKIIDNNINFSRLMYICCSSAGTVCNDWISCIVMLQTMTILWYNKLGKCKK